MFVWLMSTDITYDQIDRKSSHDWLVYPSEKYAFVSWDDEIPNNCMEQKMFQTTNQ